MEILPTFIRIMIEDKEQTILFLPAWYPNQYDNMGGMFARYHAIALQKEVKVHVLYVSAHKNLKKTFEFVPTLDLVPTYILYYRKPAGKNPLTVFYEGVLYLLATFLAYKNYRKLHPAPTLYHVHVLTRAAMLPLLLSFFSKTKYVITEHWSRYLAQNNSYNGFLRKFLTRLVVKRAAGLSTVSNALRQAMIGHQLDHVNFPLISNVVPPAFFGAYVKTENKIKRFVHVSCFDEKSKNIKGMLKAFELLKQKNLDFQLYLVGNGPDKKLIEDFLLQLNLDNVFFTGELLADELIEQYRKADALILFSNYENQPCVILEAHAVGIPVIASNVGGIPELVNHKLGVLVEVGNYHDLAQKLEGFIHSTTDFDSIYIRDYAQKNYTETVVAKKIIEFYNHSL